MARKPETTAFWVGRLPHWEVEGGRYFITLHLAGAIPAAGRAKVRHVSTQLREASDRHAPDWLRIQRAIFAEMERWLDRAEWNPLLARREIADIVADAIEHRQKRGDWQVHEYVIMPTHVHLFCEIGASGMKAVMEDFKRWTGHQVGPICRKEPGDDSRSRPASGAGDESRSRPAGGTYRFWQREWFDHWSRFDEEDERIILYIRNNPVKALLVDDYRNWPFASWSRSCLPDGT